MSSSPPPSALAGRTVLLLSPHADDVAFSVGGLIAGWGPQLRLQMLTAFGRSGWALLPSLRKQSVDAVSAARRLEDSAYCGKHGIDHVVLDCPDSYVMGYNEAKELNTPLNQDPRTGDMVKLIGDALCRLRPDVVIAPSALGGHIDHRIVRAAAEAWGRADIFYYEDIPYSAYLTLGEIQRELGAQGLEPAMSIDIDAAMEEKCGDMWSYRTQTSAPTVAEMRLHAARLSMGAARYVERLWRARPEGVQ